MMWLGKLRENKVITAILLYKLKPPEYLVPNFTRVADGTDKSVAKRERMHLKGPKRRKTSHASVPLKVTKTTPCLPEPLRSNYTPPQGLAVRKEGMHSPICSIPTASIQDDCDLSK